MKIYTRKGDQGKTSLLGGERVEKDHIRIEAYGTIDELNSWIGLIRDVSGNEEINTWLTAVQNELFTLGSHLAVSGEHKNLQLPALNEELPGRLEQYIDQMEQQLPPLKNFILPGGNQVVSYCHIARCVCRRAERRTVSLASVEEIPELPIRTLNRLSDFLFVLSRKLAHDLSAPEQPWTPRK